MANHYSGGVPNAGTLVGDFETLLRCLPASTWDWEADAPTTASLSFGKREPNLSVYLLELLRTRSLGPEAAKQHREKQGVMAISALLARQLDCTVSHSPTVSTPPRDADFAHGDFDRVVPKERWLEVRDMLLAACEVLIRPTRPGAEA